MLTQLVSVSWPDTKTWKSFNKNYLIFKWKRIIGALNVYVVQLCSFLMRIKVIPKMPRCHVMSLHKVFTPKLDNNVFIRDHPLDLLWSLLIQRRRDRCVVCSNQCLLGLCQDSSVPPYLLHQWEDWELMVHMLRQWVWRRYSVTSYILQSVYSTMPLEGIPW